MQNRLSRYLEGRFLKLSAYFFGMRIILLNFAEKITGMEKTVLLEPGLKISEVEDKIFIIRNQRVILDRDVALLYHVETKRINEAVRNNPDKFPDGYVIELTSEESSCLRSKISTLDKLGRGQHTKYNLKVFTEKGLYMLATILKSPVATSTTILIIEAFAEISELSRNLSLLSEIDDDVQQQQLGRKCGDIISQIITENTEASDTETTIEVNLAMLKIKHTIKRKKQ